MLKQIKADFYRLFRSKSFYLIMGIALIFNVFMILMFGVYSIALDNIEASELNAETITLIQSTLPSTFPEYIQMFFMGNSTILYLIILLLIFCGAEYNRGYIKNVATLVFPRYLTVFSKIIITVFATILIYLITLAVLLIGCSALSVDMSGIEPAALIKFLLTGILMNVSLTSFVLMIFYITRKSVPALISGIVYTTMGQLIFTFLNLAVKAVFKTNDFDITKFLNIGNMLTHVTMDADNATYIRSIIVAIVIMGISVGVSCISMQKKDIR